MKTFVIAALLSLSLAASAQAQQYPSAAWAAPTIDSQLPPLTVTSNSSSVALPAPPITANNVTAGLLLVNDGPATLYWQWGATATFDGGFPLFSGTAICVGAGNNTTLSAITAGVADVATRLRVFVVSSCLNFSRIF